MIKVNKCGKTEDSFVDGWCKECLSSCKMNEEQMIDKRVYDYADKHGILSYGTFLDMKFELYFENHSVEQEPKYIQNYLKQLKD